VVSLPQGCAYTESGYTALIIWTRILHQRFWFQDHNVNVIGQYILTYRVKDDLNNESFVTRTVNVVVNQNR
jgi:hypothetical protein